MHSANTSARQILKERDDRAKIAKRNKGKLVEGEDELAIRERERASIEALAAGPDHEVGTNPTALYELCGKDRDLSSIESLTGSDGHAQRSISRFR